MIEPDLLGDALRDEVAGRRVDELLLVILPDEAWPVEMTHFLGIDPLSDVEERVLARCRGRVLDIGAGAGRHSVVLTGRGLELDALDISQGAAEVMRGRGLTRVHCADWRVFLRAEGASYDTILLLNRGLGLLGSTDGFREFLRAARRALRPGGQLLTDCMPPPAATEGGEAVHSPGESPAVRLREMYLRYGDREGGHFAFLEMTLDLVRAITREEGWSLDLIAEGPPFAISLTPGA